MKRRVSLLAIAVALILVVGLLAANTATALAAPPKVLEADICERGQGRPPFCPVASE